MEEGTFALMRIQRGTINLTMAALTLAQRWQRSGKIGRRRHESSSWRSAGCFSGLDLVGGRMRSSGGGLIQVAALASGKAERNC